MHLPFISLLFSHLLKIDLVSYLKFSLSEVYGICVFIYAIMSSKDPILYLAPHCICLFSSSSECREVKLFVERKWWSLKFSISRWIEVWCQIPTISQNWIFYRYSWVCFFFFLSCSVKAPQIVGYFESYYYLSDIMHYRQDKPNVSNLTHF